MSTKSFDEKYDGVVIGAGLGGLTCALYLAQNGMRVKVFEQHLKPGGYCSSFVRKGFSFGAAADVFWGCEEGGNLYRALSTLGLKDKLEFHKLDPFCKVIFPDESFIIPASIDEFAEMLSNRFPSERTGITNLFDAIKSISRGYFEEIEKLPSASSLFMKYKDRTFQEFVNDYVTDNRLKSFISSIYLGGLAPSKQGAVYRAGALMRFLSEGAYLLTGGSQVFADVFVKELENCEGKLELRTMVKKILVENGKAVGIETADGRRIGAEYVISNAAAKQTFFELVGNQELKSDFINRLNDMEICISGFMVYIGTDIDSKALGITGKRCFIHTTPDIEKEWAATRKGDLANSCILVKIPTLIEPSLCPPKNHTVLIFTYAPYHLDGKDWREEKAKVTNELVKMAEQFIPGLSKHIVVLDSATPLTMEKYTLNTEGAVSGWSRSPKTTLLGRLEPSTPIENLYLTGHWTRPGGTITGVTASGIMVGQMILEDAGWSRK
ncbi:phytoene desaturase family protein [Chloroflexota bacterium]